MTTNPTIRIAHETFGTEPRTVVSGPLYEARCDGQTILLSIERDQYLHLNGSGSVIWQMLREGRTPTEIEKALARNFGISVDSAAEDVGRFIATLISHGIVALRTTGTPRQAPVPSEQTRRRDRPTGRLRDALDFLWIVALAKSGLVFGGLHKALQLTGCQVCCDSDQSPDVLSDADRAAIETAVCYLDRLALYYPGRVECLEQSLILCALLRRSGRPAQIRFGVEFYPFRAHAWVELKGHALLADDDAVRMYAPLNRIN